ncbi:glycosyltransferase family 9 protein, partial [Bradyrhizobium sp. NBAIM08]|uniref:glycosyltransferase family 9 protein n=1 Tax=Bradyrhizobium sp. NBAIM08 TaxID=2793815 RepID=UPI0023EF2777
MTFDDGDSVFSVAQRLRAEHFDLAVVFPNSLRSALESFLARIPQRVGYACNGRGLFLNRAVPPRAGAVRMHKRSTAEVKGRVAENLARETYPPTAHHVHDYLQLVAALGANPAPLPPCLRVGTEEIA